MPHVVLAVKPVQGAGLKVSAAILWIINPLSDLGGAGNARWGQSGLLNEASLWLLFGLLFDWQLIKVAEIKASTRRASGSSESATNRFACPHMVLL